MTSRYVVWQEDRFMTSRVSVSELLRDFPEVEILRAKDPDHAVVLMDTQTELKVRSEHPQLSVEPDIRHRMASGQ